jgi:hypothetical protein
MIKQYILSEMTEIHMICFVVDSTKIRLTSYEEYVYEEILKLFSKDVNSNIVFIFTFSTSN